VGPDQSAADFVMFNSNPTQEFLYMGAYYTNGAWTLDNSCAAETSVRGILFSTPLSQGQVCIDTLEYSGFNIDHNWFECGIGIQTEGDIGTISDNTFDENTVTGINLEDYGDNNYYNGTHSLLIHANKVFYQQTGININGTSGVAIEDNTFNYAFGTDVNIYSGSGCGTGGTAPCVTKGLKIVGNNFVTNPIPGNQIPPAHDGYSCSNNYHVEIGSALQDSVIASNTFKRGHTDDISVGTDAALNNVSIISNSFEGACDPNECPSTCESDQMKNAGSQQGNSLDIAPSTQSTSSNVTVADNTFANPGNYAVRTTIPVSLLSNTCHNPFYTQPIPSNNYQNGCFEFVASGASGSLAYSNFTDSTASAAVVAYNGTNNVRFIGNRSGWSSDVVTYGTGFSSWGERVSNAGGSGELASMDPTTGNAYLGGTLNVVGGYAANGSAGVTGSFTIGSCTLTFTGGILTAHSGC
jgi:hypothetical protein